MKPEYEVMSRMECMTFVVAETKVTLMEVRVRGLPIRSKTDDPTHGLYTYGAEREPLVLMLPMSEWDSYPPGKKLRLAPLEE